MRKLDHTDEDSYLFHLRVLESKNITQSDPHYKTRVAAGNAAIQVLLNNYDKRFTNKDLESLTAHGFVDPTKEDLKKLYSYKSKVLQELKFKVTTTAENRSLNTCQCCTIGEVNSFDHLVPQEEFPEFSVAPKNLFPSCTKCNNYKGSIWRVSGRRRFLNLYLDDLPTAQYLFVKLKVDDSGLVETIFEIRNDNKIPDAIFQLLSSHYAGLHLCDRFSQNADSVIVELGNSISGAEKKLSKNDLKTQIKVVTKRNMAYFGFNHWKSILELALVENDDFFDRFY